MTVASALAGASSHASEAHQRATDDDAPAISNSTVRRFLAFGGKPYSKPSGEGGFLGWGARMAPEPSDPYVADDAAYEAVAQRARRRAVRLGTEEMVRSEAEAILTETLVEGTPVADMRFRAIAQTVRAFDFASGAPGAPICGTVYR